MTSRDILKTPVRRLAGDRATARLGCAIAALLQIGDAVCLSGPLGAGKSTLARALIRALTTPLEDVPSPTFTLVQTYDTPRLAVAHFDLYRLTNAAEVHELGLDEALDEGAALIEWPERLEGRLPPDRLDVELSLSPGVDTDRGVRLAGVGTWASRAAQLAWERDD